VLIPLTIAPAAADEPWPRFRGADGAGQGGALRFPRQWGDADWAWTVRLPGAGHASPVVWGDHVYTASGEPDPTDAARGTRIVSCHGLADGRLLWAVRLPGPFDRHHAMNSSASGSLAAGPAGVCWLWGTAAGVHLAALDHDGTRQWQVDLGPFVSEHGYAGTPTVHGDLVIVAVEHEGPSFVAAFDRATGRERWRLPREPGRATYATPLLVPGPPPQLVVASTTHGLTGIDPATGTVAWERRCFPKRAVSSPVAIGPAGERLVIGTCGDGGGDNALFALRVPAPLAGEARQLAGEARPLAGKARPLAGKARPLAGKARPPEPEVAFQLDRSVAPYVPTPVLGVAGLHLWGDRGVLTCVDPVTGVVRWRGRVGGSYSASPIVVGGTVVNVSGDGEVVVVADGDAFEVLGRTALGEECRSTPAVVGTRMVFRSNTTLRAIDSLPAAAGR
jgi:outer membrane protein assembly factor BamB